MSAQIISLSEYAKSQDNVSHSKEKSVPLENVPLENPVPVQHGIFTEELLLDVTTLSKTALRKKYRHEANVHKSRKSQGKGAFAPEFQDFASFLTHAGICPHPDWSLDRIDNNNPDYGPGLCRWASPKTQTRNRWTTVMLTVDGETKPLAEWAEITGLVLRGCASATSDTRTTLAG